MTCHDINTKNSDSKQCITQVKNINNALTQAISNISVNTNWKRKNNVYKKNYAPMTSLKSD